MNRHFTGTLAFTLAIAMAGLVAAQTYPMPYPSQPHTAQNAVYYASPGQAAGASFAAAQQPLPPGAG